MNKHDLSKPVRTGRNTSYEAWMDAVAESQLAKGYPDSAVALECGISQRTLYNWITAGLDGDERYQGFCIAMERGRIQFERTCLDTIRNGYNGWQSAAWLLERTRATRYARPMAVKDPTTADEDRTMIVEVVYTQSSMPQHANPAAEIPMHASDSTSAHKPGQVASSEGNSIAVKVTSRKYRKHEESPLEQPMHTVEHETDILPAGYDDDSDAVRVTAPITVDGAIEGEFKPLVNSTSRFPHSKVNT